MKSGLLAAGFMLCATLLWAADADRNEVPRPRVAPPKEERFKVPPKFSADEDPQSGGETDAATDDSATGDPPADEKSAESTSEDDAATLPPALRRLDPAPNDRSPASERLRPSELLGQLLTPINEQDLTGNSLSLVEVLRRTAGDRPRQIKGALAYWRLSAAEGVFYAAVQAYNRFDNGALQQEGKPAIRAARSQFKALVLHDKQRVVEAQSDLLAIMDLPADGKGPLASDRPHLGRYETYFQEKFTGAAIPRRLLLLDRRLPKWRDLIDQRCDCVQAALDVAAETSQAIDGDQPNAREWISACDGVYHQQRAFLEAVRDYNSDIAEYALTVAPTTATPEVLVGMLIAPKKPAKAEPAAETGARTAAPSALRRFLLASAVVADPLFQGLVGKPPGEQSQKLGRLLHQAAESADTQPITLRQCLERASRNGWGQLLPAYWQASAAAARQEILAGVQEQLLLLDASAVAAAGQPGGGRAGLLLEAAKRACRAEQTAQEIQLMNARFELTTLAGGSLQQPWLAAGSTPHAGGYQLPDTTSPRSARQAGLATTIELLQDELRHRAAAIVEADHHRVAVMNEEQRDRGESPLTAELAAIAEQRHCTLGFVGAVERYNDAISEYALAVAPANISAARLADALILADKE